MAGFHETDHDTNSPSSGPSHHEGDYDGDYVAIIQLSGGGDLYANFVMLFNDDQISVTVVAPCQSSERSIEKHLIGLINQMSCGKGEVNSIMNEILDAIQPDGEVEFRRVAPKPPARSTSDANANLHSLLYPKIHYFAFRRDAPDAQPKIVPMSLDEVESRYGTLPYDAGRLGKDGADGRYNEIRSLLSRHQHLPRFTTKEIDVVEEILSSGAVTRIRVMSRDGDDVGIDSHITSRDLLCKATEGFRWRIGIATLRRELACLLTLHEHNHEASSSPTKSMRVSTPRPFGLVTHPENGDVVGFFREWIPGERLTNVLKRGTPLPTHKQRWPNSFASPSTLYTPLALSGATEKRATSSSKGPT